MVYRPWAQKVSDTTEQLTLSPAWSHVSCLPLASTYMAIPPGWVLASHREPVVFAGAGCVSSLCP